MPVLVDYATVLETMQRQGFKSLYYNSGAFGFADPAGVGHVGWAIGEDPTLREGAKGLVRRVEPATVERLSELAAEAWERFFPGVAWVMPMAHWAYELDFGSREWLPGVLAGEGLEVGVMEGLTTGNALQYSTGERQNFTKLTQNLLENLQMSDFLLTFPDFRVVCTVHHHKQLWWSSRDEGVLEGLRGMAGEKLE